MSDVDWEQRLYDAADGNLEGLLEMWHEHQQAGGEAGTPNAADPGTVDGEAVTVGQEARSPKKYTAAQREKATTMPDGSFPIDNVADLKRAIQSVGRAKDPARAKRWIIKRARDLGATNLLPEGWGVRNMTEMDFDRLADAPEKRAASFTDVEMSRDGRTFRGLAAVYDSVTDLGEYTESMARGSFRKALSASNNVPMLYDHNPGLPVLATTRSGTLRLKDDTRGLVVEADVANHFVGEAVREMVQRGDIAGMSVGFISGRGNSRIEQRADKPHREILNFKQLLDVSPTWDPAYQSTEAAFRSLRAVQMAESLEAAQQVLQGAHQQLEDGVQLPDTDASIDLAPTDDDDLRVPDRDTVGPSPELAHSGVGEARNLLAARKRRLALLGVTLLTTDKV